MVKQGKKRTERKVAAKASLSVNARNLRQAVTQHTKKKKHTKKKNTQKKECRTKCYTKG